MGYGTGAYRTGRCLNDLYCASASAQQNIQVPAGGQFVCPQCGKPLSDPPLEKRKFMAPALVACGVLAASGGALFVVGAMIGKGKPADAMVVQSTPRPVAKPADSAPAPAPPETKADANVPARTQAAGPSQLVPAVAAATQNTPPPPVHQAPDARLAMVQTAPSPSEVQARAETAELAQARENARRQARAAALAKRAEAALAAQKLAALQAQDARKKALIQQQEAEQEAQARQDADAARAAQAARVAQAQADARAKARLLAEQPESPPVTPVRTVQVAPAAPKGPTRGFSAAAVAGGAPSYPAVYDDGRRGRVTVSCLISQSGSPSGCHVLSSQGGIGFSNEALGWLHSGQVRFAPILRDGQPRAEEHSWSISFVP